MTEPGGADLPARWQDALLVVQLVAIDPAGLGGVAVRAGPGPTRDLWLSCLRQALAAEAPIRRLPAGIEDDRLLGGVDLVATLRSGRPVLQRGVLAEADGGFVVIPMAERLSPGSAARIAQVLDRHVLEIQREGLSQLVPTRIGLIALDESQADEQSVPEGLMTRLGFHLDLGDLGMRGLSPDRLDPEVTAAARRMLGAVAPASAEVMQALVGTAAQFGIDSVTAPMLALRAARAAAALAGRGVILRDDAVLAARLVLGPRARTAPAEPEQPPDQGDAPDDSPPPPPESQGESERSNEAPSLDEIMVAAVQAALPDALLASLRSGALERGPSSRRQGSGANQASPLRGRPAGVRLGALRPGARLALVDTLRAAAPWQAVRRRESASVGRIDVRREDFRLKKFVQRKESTIVFCVDASGSAAFARLAETKGAVELLLGEAYVERTYAALVVFRGQGADLLLPPTRSLSRAKALLANLPGGGGTPLAAGIDSAVLTALAERAKGREPLLVMLTDGRANIARDGQATRQRANADALAAARQSGAMGLNAVFVDTAPRPRGDAAELAAAMGARYVALPYVEAAAVRNVVREIKR